MRICSLNTNLLLPTTNCINTTTTRVFAPSIVACTTPQPHSIPRTTRRRRNNNTVIIFNSLSFHSIPIPIPIPTHKHKQKKPLLHVWNCPPINKNKNLNLSIRACGAASLELPLLPFPLDQVLVPTESKTLHLYEARYLNLLDESLHKKSKLFVHFVLEPFVISSRSAEASFAAKYGCLVFIEKVEQLDVGALVTIRGIGRVTLVNFVKAEPFIEGVVIPLQDDVPENTSEINDKTAELTMALQNLNSLEIKLKAAKDALLQTQTASSLKWLEKDSSLYSNEAFIPSVAERVSFAALQTVSGASESELEKLQEEKLKAMDSYDTLERLQNSLKLVNENVSLVLAKLAIQSLNLK